MKFSVFIRQGRAVPGSAIAAALRAKPFSSLTRVCSDTFWQYFIQPLDRINFFHFFQKNILAPCHLVNADVFIDADDKNQRLKNTE